MNIKSSFDMCSKAAVIYSGAAKRYTDPQEAVDGSQLLAET